MEDLLPRASAQLLDLARSKLGLTSDYKLALALGWRPQKVYGYRSGPDCMDVEKALAFSEKTGIPLKEVAEAIVQDKHRRKRNQTNGAAIAA